MCFHAYYTLCVKQRQRFRFYPTSAQQATLARVFGSCRFVYNWALRLRTDAFAVGKSINYNQSSTALTALKRQDEYFWLNVISCVPTQQVLRHLQTAFRNFFEKRTRYPSFKSKHGKQAAEYTRSAFKYDAVNHILSISQLGKLKIHWSQKFTSIPTTVTITKDRAGRYFVTLVLDEAVKPLPKTGEVVGIDLGISRLATLSNGERIPNPRHLRSSEQKLARAQHVLSRRKKGSGRWNRARLRVAKLHAHIADARVDYLHKVTTDLIRRFDVICMEDLHIRGMLRNHCLAKSLSDAGLGQFSQMVEYKCAWYGKELRRVDRFYPSSKRCNTCGHVVASLPLSVREWDCPECATHHDRDENASKNILGAGLAPTARGGRVRPAAAKVTVGTVCRSVNHLEPPGSGIPRL